MVGKRIEAAGVATVADDSFLVFIWRDYGEGGRTSVVLPPAKVIHNFRVEIGRLIDGGIDLAFGEAGAEALAAGGFGGVAENGAGRGVGGDGVAAVQCVLGAEEAKVLAELIQMLAFAAEAIADTEAAEVFGGVAEGFARVADLSAGGTFELIAEFVQMLLAFAEHAHWLAAFEGLASVVEFFATPLDALMNEPAEAGFKFSESLAAGDGGFGDLFGGGAGRGGAEIGGEIADGEIDFVADRADDWKFGGDDGAGSQFFVKGPQVFKAAAASRNQNKVERMPADFRKVIEKFEAASDLTRRVGTLHSAGRQEYFERRITAFDDVQDIVQCSAIEAGDEADARREFGNGAFSSWREEAFGVEFLFEAFEGGLEFSRALKFQVNDAKLILSARFINGHFTLKNYRLAILKKTPVKAAAISLE